MPQGHMKGEYAGVMAVFVKVWSAKVIYSSYTGGEKCILDTFILIIFIIIAKISVSTWVQYYRFPTDLRNLFDRTKGEPPKQVGLIQWSELTRQRCLERAMELGPSNTKAAGLRFFQTYFKAARFMWQVVLTIKKSREENLLASYSSCKRNQMDGKS